MMPAEKEFRLKVIHEMFAGFGMTPTEDRIRYYANCTAHVPAHIYKQAFRNAALNNSSGFAPSVGEVMAEALKLAPGQRSESGDTCLPRWYRQQLGYISQQEKPKELGARGQAAEDVAKEILG